MANGFENVRPGDVISSDLMNYILDKLEEIDQRVLSLEAEEATAGEVDIADFDPPIQVEIGRVLAILGSNFEFPSELNTVTIDNIEVLEFRPASTSARLEFIVPDVPDVSTGGKNVTINVTNSKGSDERLYRILPAVPVVGEHRCHPILVGASVVAEFAAADADRGAHHVVRRDPERVRRVAADDPRLTLDINTPEEARAAGITVIL